MDLCNIQLGINLMQEYKAVYTNILCVDKTVCMFKFANAITNQASGVLLNGVFAALNSRKPEGGGLVRLFIVKNLKSNITAMPYSVCVRFLRKSSQASPEMLIVASSRQNHEITLNFLFREIILVRFVNFSSVFYIVICGYHTKKCHYFSFHCFFYNPFFVYK